MFTVCAYYDFVLIRKCFTEKPISIDKFIRKQK